MWRCLKRIAKLKERKRVSKKPKLPGWLIGIIKRDKYYPGVWMILMATLLLYIGYYYYLDYLEEVKRGYDSLGNDKWFKTMLWGVIMMIFGVYSLVDAYVTKNKHK